MKLVPQEQEEDRRRQPVAVLIEVRLRGGRRVLVRGRGFDAELFGQVVGALEKWEGAQISNNTRIVFRIWILVFGLVGSNG